MVQAFHYVNLSLLTISIIVRGFWNRFDSARMWRLRWDETSEANVARIQHVWAEVLQRWREAQAAAAATAAAPDASDPIASSGEAVADNGNGNGNGNGVAGANAGGPDTSPPAPAPDAVTNPLIERVADGAHEKHAEGRGEGANAHNRAPRDAKQEEVKTMGKARRAAPRAAAYPPLFSMLMRIYSGGLLGSQLLMLLSLLFLFANPMLLWFASE